MCFRNLLSFTASKLPGEQPARAGLLATLFVLLIPGFARGQSVANFSLKDAITDKPISLGDFGKEKGLVIIFSSNNCPYDNYYTERINALAVEYAGTLPILLVNSHRQQEENESEMKKRQGRDKLSVPYLSDKDQQLMGSLGATKSPEAFLLRNERGNFSVVYRGAIDDNPQVAGDVDHAFLREAIRQFLTGQAQAVSQTRPVGCSIRKR